MSRQEEKYKVISPAYLREIYRLDDDGRLWVKKSNRPVTRISPQGYVTLKVGKNGIFYNFQAHVVVWALVNGEWPSDQIDHINRVRSDNRPSNLRLASNGMNAWNQTQRKDNTSGYKNVVRRHGRWQVKLFIGGVWRCFGNFKDVELAGLVAYEARRRHYGEAFA